MLSPERLETYMRHVGMDSYESVPIPPFVAFFHPRNPLKYLNYARPVAPSGGDLSAPLAAYRDACKTRERVPRFEFVEEFAPRLAASLERDRFTREDRYLLMTCTPETYRPAPPVPGLELIEVTAVSPPSDIIDFRMSVGGSFGEAAETPSAEEIQRFRDESCEGGNFLAHLDGTPVGGGSFTSPLDGLTEVAGIGTLPDYRRQGIAGAVTARLVEAAFARGVEIAFLTAADERAGRVYERVGFRQYASLLAYVDGRATG